MSACKLLRPTCKLLRELVNVCAPAEAFDMPAMVQDTVAKREDFKACPTADAKPRPAADLLSSGLWASTLKVVKLWEPLSHQGWALALDDITPLSEGAPALEELWLWLHVPNSEWATPPSPRAPIANR